MASQDDGSMESALREAFDRSASDDAAINMDALRDRAHHELHVRDLIGFGFSHLIRAVLAILGCVYNQVHQTPAERS